MHGVVVLHPAIVLILSFSRGIPLGKYSSRQDGDFKVYAAGCFSRASRFGIVIL
jgi:hypothetical protein